MSVAASRICGAAPLPLVPLCGAAGGSLLTSEQKFRVTLLFFFSDTFVTLSQKKHMQGIAQVGKIGNELQTS